MAGNEKRGRPRTYQYEERRKLARLLRRHGARRTREIYTTKVCIGTLLKIAREFGIELQPGRRPGSVAFTRRSKRTA